MYRNDPQTVNPGPYNVNPDTLPGYGINPAFEPTTNSGWVQPQQTNFNQFGVK